MLYLTIAGQTLSPILADRLQHGQAGFSVALRALYLQQTLVTHGSYLIEYMLRLLTERFTDGFGCLDRTATGEDCKPAKEALFPGIEQIVAPLKGVTQGLLPGGTIPPSLCQNSQPVLQAR